MNKYTTVSEFMDDLSAGKREQVEALQSIVKKASNELVEHIKWNSPSYALNGEDRITFNLQNKENVVKLVLHMGATKKEDKKGVPVMKDDSGMISWQSDIRGLISFADLEDIKTRQKELHDIVTHWLVLGS